MQGDRFPDAGDVGGGDAVLGQQRGSQGGASDLEPGEEIAMVLSLEPDATLAPNPTIGTPASREGPLS